MIQYRHGLELHQVSSL